MSHTSENFFDKKQFERTDSKREQLDIRDPKLANVQRSQSRNLDHNNIQLNKQVDFKNDLTK
jgi:hypothetical protein